VSLRSEEAKLRRRLAAALRRERSRLGWTQELAAEKANMNIRHYQKLEAGAVNVTLRSLARLCHAFDVEIRRLFEN